jgi:hypothetical protein
MIEKYKEVNITECVGVSVEAATILGLNIAKDPEQLNEVLKNEYLKLIEGQNRPGEPFRHLPLENDYQLRKMLDIIDDHTYDGDRKYTRFSVWHKTHWTHGAKDISHLLMGLGRHQKHSADLVDLVGQSRLALTDGENPIFPFVHFSDKPHSKENVSKDDNEKDSETQLEAFEARREIYELNNPNFDMFYFDAATCVILGLQSRIRGDKYNALFGAVILPELGQSKDKLGQPAVSMFHITAIGQIGLGLSRGDRSFGTGVGIAVGYNKTTP